MANRPFKDHISNVIGSLVVLAGISVLLGWGFDITLLKSVANNFVTMKVNSAIAFTLLGLALIYRPVDPGKVSWRQLLCACFAVIIVLVTLCEYVFQWDAGIDELFIRDNLSLPDSYPGRPSVITASTILFLGVALLICVGKRGRKMAEALSAMVMLVALVSVVGYILNVEALYEATVYSAIALHTSIMLLLVSAAVWWSTPENLLEKYLSGPKSTGIMTRHLLFFALIVPIALGLLWLQGVRAGLYSYELGWALLVITGIACLVGFMVMTGTSLLKLEKERTRILQQLCLSTDELEGYATELETANRLLHEMSYSDPLTGLSNRRAFDECLEDEFKSLNRYHRPLSLLLIDLDKFKLYNDRFGHQAGDEALQTVGKILRENARDTDSVARVGGEEFAVVLTETSLDGANIQAERFRHEIEKYDWPLHSITVSIGVATASVAASDPVSLFKEADKALYEAKDQGRNQVCTTQKINITELRTEMIAGAPE